MCWQVMTKYFYSPHSAPKIILSADSAYFLHSFSTFLQNHPLPTAHVLSQEKRKRERERERERERDVRTTHKLTNLTHVFDNYFCCRC